MIADPLQHAHSGDPAHLHADVPPAVAADSPAEFGRHWSAAWAAMRLHTTIVADEAVGGLYHFLILGSLAAISLSSIILLMTFGGYFLVSGIALGLGELAGNPWLGRALAGGLFLVCPLAIGLIAVAMLRRSRDHRLLGIYRDLHAQAGSP